MKTRSFSQTFLAASIVTVLAVFAFAAHANADRIENSSKDWVGGLKAAIRTKDVAINPVDLGTNTLPTNVRTRLADIADEQAQVWADTILEGDYVAENDVNVETVETVQMNTIFLGYRITYSSAAFDTSNCDAAKDISQCEHGRIVESSFVAPSLNSWIRDAKHLATFVPDKTTGEPQE